MGGRGGSGKSGGNLRGTEKQISYAKDIKKKAISAIDEGFKDAVKKMNPTQSQLEQAKKNIKEAKRIINSETDAGAIISEFQGISFRGGTESTFGDVMSALSRLKSRKR